MCCIYIWIGCEYRKITPKPFDQAAKGQLTLKKQNDSSVYVAAAVHDQTPIYTLVLYLVRHNCTEICKPSDLLRHSILS